MKYILALLSTMLVCNLFAQTAWIDTAARNKMYFQFKIEPASMITIGYQKPARQKIFKRDLNPYYEISTSLYQIGFANSEAKVGEMISIYESGNFKFITRLNLSVGHVKTCNFNSTKIAAEDEIGIGFYKKKSFIALTAEYEDIYFNYIKHTRYYKETYYEDAIDGWYKGGGGTFQFGMEAGVTIQEKIDSFISIKVPFTEEFNGYGGSPFHVKVGFAYHF